MAVRVSILPETFNENTTGNNFTAAATTFEVDNSTEITFEDNDYPETVLITIKNNACFEEDSQLGTAADGTICG